MQLWGTLEVERGGGSYATFGYLGSIKEGVVVPYRGTLEVERRG